jgi:hypothetical protein
MALIYGVDTDKDISPLEARDAILTCFAKAHCQDAGLSDKPEDQDTVSSYCKEIVKEGFRQTNGNFDDPNKESLMKVVGYLVEFSKSFRNPKIIEEHKEEIMQILSKIKDN